MRSRLLLLALIALPALAADKDKKGKLDLGLKIDTGSSVPKGDGLEKPKEKKQKTESSTTATDLSYEVVKVAHAKSFMHGPTGASPQGAFDAIPAGGNPLMTEKFTTVVRVKCAQRVTASIELTVLDGRSNEIMSGGGTLYFRNAKEIESDYELDWDPTPVRQAGEYTLNVKVAGNVVGTFPLKIVDKNAPKSTDAGR